MNLELILEQHTKSEIEEFLLSKGYTKTFLQGKNKKTLAQAYLDSIAPKPFGCHTNEMKRIPRCESY